MKDENFITIANQYKDTIYRVAFNYFKNRYDAEDVVQDVLLKLYTHKKDFESDDYTRHWLIRVTINRCKNILRAPWKKKLVSMLEISDNAVFDSPTENELLTDVMKLPEKYRIILYLFYYEDYSVKEIATLLKISESAVTTRLTRGRTQLKLALKEV